MTDPAPPSPDTYLAVGELVQAAAHAHGLTGPVQYTVCNPEPPASADGQFVSHSEPCNDQ